MATFDIRQVPDGADLADAHEVRYDVFVEEQDVDESIEWDDLDAEATHLVAYAGDRPVGTARLRESDPGVAKIERVAVRESYRDRGLGRDLMYELEDLARSGGMDEAVLHAQTRVEGFYRRLGYETVGEEFEEAGIPHVKMVKAL